MAHAEASARTVDAAVSAAAAELGLRSDQVDIQVLEEPVPSTFGFIGSPARVRVTPRSATTSQSRSQPQSVSSTTNSSQLSEPPIDATTVAGDAMSPAGFLAPADVPDPAGPATPPSPPIAAAVAQAVSAPLHDPSSPSSDPESGLAAGSAAEWTPGAGPDPENGQAPGPVGTPPESQGEPPSVGSRNAADPGSSIATDIPTDPDSPPTADALPTGAPAATAPTVAVPAADAPSVGSSGAGSSPSGVGGSGPEATTESPTAPAGESPALEMAPPAFAEQGARPGRSPRRTYRDEPIDPQMVEEDTERAGDFLEGLLDAMDVDGDITTWVDSVGGHIDLEGPDLDMLVGANGETLDALQELTRLAVLRQSKRRVRLLIDINGFRAQQRDRLVSMVNAAAEQVIRSREDHEFQPMTPAERKVVHDAVAAIDGVRTESLGEDPNRRVVIQPE